MKSLALLFLLLAVQAEADLTNRIEHAASPEIETRLQEGFDALRAGQHHEAIAILRGVLASEPGNRAAKYGISSALIQQDKVREAQAVLESLMQQYPDDFVLKNNAAWLYATTTNRAFRNPPRAVALAQEALRLAPNDYQVWSTLADAHYAAGDFDKAVRAAAQAVNVARRAGAAAKAESYQQQLDRMRKAEEAFSLIE